MEYHSWSPELVADLTPEQQQLLYHKAKQEGTGTVTCASLDEARLISAKIKRARSNG